MTGKDKQKEGYCSTCMSKTLLVLHEDEWQCCICGFVCEIEPKDNYKMTVYEREHDYYITTCSGTYFRGMCSG